MADNGLFLTLMERMEDHRADYSFLGRRLTQQRVLAVCIRRLPAGCLFDLLRCIFNVV